MRVLIISLPRTGSTSLLYKIAKEKKLIPLFEPFDGSGRFLYDGQDNIVLKTIIFQHPNNIQLSKEFDEVILLSRKNFKEHLESYSYIYHNIPLGYDSTKPYKYIAPSDKVISDSKKLLIKMKNDLQILSDVLKIPIQYYEDFFDEKSKDRLRTDLIDKIKII